MNGMATAALLLEVHDRLHEQHRKDVDIQADQHQSPKPGLLPLGWRSWADGTSA